MTKAGVNRVLIGVWFAAMVLAVFRAGWVELALVGVIVGGMLWVVSHLVAPGARDDRG